MNLTKAINLAMSEIEWDVAESKVPSSVRSFEELQDYVDANEYGARYSTWPEDLEFDEHAYICFVHGLENALDAWLQAGRPDYWRE